MHLAHEELSEIDLNLLVVLDALLQESSVTRAARRVGLSQSAVSHALRRLRELLGDPLLLRTSRGMVPTPRAQQLLDPVHQADLVATVPETLLNLLASDFPIERYPPPLPIASTSVFLVWHERTHSDPAHQWPREVVKQTCQQTTPSLLRAAAL